MSSRSSLSLSLAFALVAGTVAGACTTAERVGGKATAHAADCNGASLALPADAVVGTMDGANITAKDLGDEAADAEKKALHGYCDAVHSVRSQALDNYVTQKLVEKAAKAANQSVDDWMQAEVQKRIPEPTDAEIQAFYDARKRPGAPALEEVKGQVAMVIQREKSEEAVRGIIDELKKGVAISDKLPDVRSPPKDVDVPAHTAKKGGAGAKVRVVEFADFECPYCSRAADAVKTLHAKYGDKVEFAYRHFPLRGMHPNAQRAAEVSQCAQAQGKFWEMHDRLYAGTGLDEASMKAQAKEAGLDATKLDECLASGKATAEVEQDYQKGTALGVEGTPTFFINGRHHVGAPTVEGLTAAIDAALQSAG